MSNLDAPAVPEVRADIVVVGDGPAGSALAAALHRIGADVVLAGPDEAWGVTYGTWTDDIDATTLLAGADVWHHRCDAINVRFGRLRRIERSYGVIDNIALRKVLRSGVTHHRSRLRLHEVDAQVIVDATGWPSALQREAGDEEATVGWQTALGVVFAEPIPGVLGSEMLMDFSYPTPGWSDDIDVATFASALPVDDGWLVEETVLVASPAVEPQRLEARLAARLGLDVDAMRVAAVRTETVRIPMGTPPRAPVGNVVRYGAAAGMINPATGYSVSASITNAERVAARIVELIDSGATIDEERLGAVVWPAAQRRTRLLHDYGLSVMARLDTPSLRRFFDTFFDLPTSKWASYFRVETPPPALARTMLTMFRAAPWALRRQLVSSNPRPFLRLLRP